MDVLIVGPAMEVKAIRAIVAPVPAQTAAQHARVVADVMPRALNAVDVTVSAPVVVAHVPTTVVDVREVVKEPVAASAIAAAAVIPVVLVVKAPVKAAGVVVAHVLIIVVADALLVLDVRADVQEPALAVVEPAPQTAIRVVPADAQQAVSRAVPAYAKLTAPAYAQLIVADNALHLVRSDALRPVHQAALIRLWLRKRRCHHDDERTDKRTERQNRRFI